MSKRKNITGNLFKSLFFLIIAAFLIRFIAEKPVVFLRILIAIVGFGTCIIVHVLDISEDSHLTNYQILENELTKYQKSLADRVKIIVLNKIDLVDSDMVVEIEEVYKDKGLTTISVSALSGDGIPGLRRQLIDKMEEIELRRELTETEDAQEIHRDD